MAAHHIKLNFVSGVLPLVSDPSACSSLSLGGNAAALSKVIYFTFLFVNSYCRVIRIVLNFFIYSLKELVL